MTTAAEAATEKRHFSPDLFTFLRELRANNDRDWFAANRDRYENSVKEPALDFIADFAPRLEALSKHFVADPRPVGGSLFRIHRDTRFSKDKTPYKTHTGIQFRHEAGKDAHAPCWYLHLAPGEVMIGAGIWHPDSDALARIRTALVDDPGGWRRATGGKAFRERFRLGGESLKRPPAGFDAGHPLIEDLKRKDFIAVAPLTDDAVTGPGFAAAFAAECKRASPLVAFLCGALGLPY